jgi:hypothetical protein
MAQPLTDDERTRIIDLARQGVARNEIARQVGRSVGTVTRTAHAAGCTFDRSATKIATAALVADAKALRAQLRVQLLDDARRLREQLWESAVERKAMTVSRGGGVSAVEIIDLYLDQPTFADKQRIMTAAAIAIDKSIALERHDDTGDAEVSDVDLWAANMLGEDASGDPIAA